MSALPRAPVALFETEAYLSMTENDSWLTLDDVGKRTKLSIHTVRDHYRKGILPASKLGRRIRVSPGQYDEYIRRLESIGSGAAEAERSTAGIVEILRAAIEAGDLDDAIAAAYRRIQSEQG